MKHSTIAFILLALFSTAALAETLTWTPPKAREDGSNFDPQTEIMHYNLVCGSVTTQIPATGGSYTVSKPDILPGYGVTDCYMVTVDTDGVESQASNLVQIEWKAPPMPPTNLLIIED